MEKRAVYVKIDAQLYKEFTKKVIDRNGLKRGAISKAVEEAIRLWLERNAHV